MSGTRRHLTRGVALAAVFALSACAAQYRSHGYVPPQEDLQMIVPGVDTRATVEDVVGVPTTQGLSTESGYYYVQSETRRFGFQWPQVVDRKVLAITFDPEGVVRNIETFGLEDGNVVPITRRVTETADSDIGFIRRLFGNIGGLAISNDDL